METEIWKDIPGYEGLYQISSHGNVRSLEREFIKSNGILCKVKAKILKNFIHKTGYEHVFLYKKNIRKSFYVHVLVFNVFIDPKVKASINHINGIKTDNFLSNLESVSMRSNVSHFMRTKKDKTSSYIGVFWDKSKDKWCSKIYFNKKLFFLGYFQDEEEAYEAYKKALEDNNLENKYM
jgi:hypothetical protein